MQPVIGTTTLRPSPTNVCSLCTVVRPYMHPFRTCMGFIPVCSQARVNSGNRLYKLLQLSIWLGRATWKGPELLHAPRVVLTFEPKSTTRGRVQRPSAREEPHRTSLCLAKAFSNRLHRLSAARRYTYYLERSIATRHSSYEASSTITSLYQVRTMRR